MKKPRSYIGVQNWYLLLPIWIQISINLNFRTNLVFTAVFRVRVKYCYLLEREVIDFLNLKGVGLI